MLGFPAKATNQAAIRFAGVAIITYFTDALVKSILE
jgi:hypothetical protein